MKMGHSYQQILIGSPKEYIPRFISAKYSAAALGRSTDILEVGMLSRGMDSLLEDVMDNDKDSQLHSIIMTLLHPRHPRSASEPLQEIKDIKDKSMFSMTFTHAELHMFSVTYTHAELHMFSVTYTHAELHMFCVTYTHAELHMICVTYTHEELHIFSVTFTYAELHMFSMTFTHTELHMFSMIFTHAVLHMFWMAFTHAELHMFSITFTHAELHMFSIIFTHAELHMFSIPFTHAELHMFMIPFTHAELHMFMIPFTHAELHMFSIPFTHAELHMFMIPFTHAELHMFCMAFTQIGVKPLMHEKPEGHLYLKLFGHELMYIDLGTLVPPSDKPSIMALLKEKLILLDSLKQLLKSQKSYLLPLLHTTVTTETGLPLWVKLDKQGLVRLHGDINVNEGPASLASSSLLTKIDSLLNVRSSGFFEMRAKVEVGLRHIWSGVEMKCSAHMDAPLSLKVSMDPDITKMIIKVKDQKPAQPLKLQSRVHTMIWRDPSMAESYLLPDDSLEIRAVDGVRPKPVMYEIGEEILGRKLILEGELLERKDELSPFAPLTGKQTLRLKYKPLIPDDLVIQLQHVRDSNDIPEDEPSSGWFPPLSWLVPSSQAGQEEDPESDSPVEDFIDLETKDLTMDQLKKRFKKDAEILKSGPKCGFVLRLADAGSQPSHQVQLATLYQREPEGKVAYSVEVRRAPKPDEDKSWRLVMDMRLELADHDIKPSDILDIEYQKHIQHQIHMSISEDGKRIDSLLDLGSDFIDKASKQLKKLLKRDRLDEIIDDTINYMIQKTTDPESIHLQDVIQKQRRVEKEIDGLGRKLIDIKYVKKVLDEVTMKIEKLEHILHKTEEMLDKIPEGDQKAEDAVAVLYIMDSQKKAEKKLDKIANKLAPYLSVAEIEDLEQKIGEQKKKLEEIQKKQQKHTIAKQPSEIQKSSLEVNPEEKDIYSHLVEVEKMLTTPAASKNKDKPMTEYDEIKEKRMKDITDNLKLLKEKIDEKLLKEPRLDKMVRVKVLEILLKQKLVDNEIEKDLKELDKKIMISYISHGQSSIDNVYDVGRRSLLQQKAVLKKATKELAERLAISLQIEKGMKSQLAYLKVGDKEAIDELKKMELKQIQHLENLKKKEISPEDLMKLMDDLKKSKDKIKKIIDSQEKSIKDKEASVTSPVVEKSLKSLVQLSQLLEKVDKAAKDKMKEKMIEGRQYGEDYKQIKRDTQEIKSEIKHMTIKCEDLLKMTKKVSKLPDHEVDEKLIPSDQPCSKLTILKKLLKVKTHQMELTPSLKKLRKLMRSPSPTGAVDKSTHLVTEKHLLYDVISKLIKAQEESDTIKDYLQHPEKSQCETPDMLKEVSDMQDKQKTLIDEVEDKLREKSKSDVSLLQPLQKIQQLKDQVQRQKHDLDILRDLKGDKKEKMGEEKQMEYHSSNSRSKDISGKIAIKYGKTDELENMITILILSKKSVEQLRWEREQQLPGRQDPLVRSYLDDRRSPDDVTSPVYMELKKKLNTRRHFEVLVAYQDGLPEPVRKMVWKSQELMKYMYSDKLTLDMPDQDSNMITVKAEFRMDGKHMDLEIKTPCETDIIRDIRTPELVKDISLQRPMEDNLLLPLLPEPVSCHVSPKRVRTLAQKTFEKEDVSPECERVLAMDCSDRHSLLISSKPLTSHPEKKIVKILSKSRKVEMIPDPKSLSPQVKVDDEPIVMPAGQEMLRVSSPDKKPVWLRRLPGGSVEVRLPHSGVSVLSDGTKISIKVPPMLSYRLCGVCGSVDGLRGPHYVEYQDPRQFLATYLIPSDRCVASEELRKHGVHEVRKQAKSVLPMTATDIKLVTKNRIPKTCFSIQPVLKCPPGTQPDTTKSQPITYHCLRSNSDRANSYLEIVKSRTLAEIKDKEPDLTEVHSLPVSCVKN
ncbi:uncharacterized protein LOC128215141 [Mya arenaria]|nr:uncharacterized protein LOC128215141 [Mya arenaria]